jgi:copper chaperone CopZ
MPDPARPDDRDPADPFVPVHGDRPVLETIEIETAGQDCDECLRKLRDPLMKIAGVQKIEIHPKRDRIVATFDARRVHAPDLHDAILKSGYKPTLRAD